MRAKGWIEQGMLGNKASDMIKRIQLAGETYRIIPRISSRGFTAFPATGTISCRGARKIAQRENGHIPQSDFNFFRDALWQLRDGRHIIAGEGHARSPYGDRQSDGSEGWGKGARIADYEEIEAYKADEHTTII